MEVAEQIAVPAAEGELLAPAATDIDLDTPVATVPDWPLRDLVRHLGGVHRWAATTIRDARQSRYDTTRLEVVGRWPDDADLVEWFRADAKSCSGTIAPFAPELAVDGIVPGELESGLRWLWRY